MLELINLTKSFGVSDVLKGVSMSVSKGEFVTLLGSSGCGKTTILNIIAGLLSPDDGHVRLDGKDIANLPPEKRDVNTVFQNYALFPHMSVEKNIAYGLKIRGLNTRERAQRVQEMLRLVRLEGFEKRKPSQLSGGQRQRVAIARAVVLNPRLLLLDEPLGALDLKLRRQMQFELKAIQKQLGIAFIYVTHDQEEALNMSDRIAVMHRGVFEQVGTPEDIYERPQTRYVAEFIGQTNLLECEVETAGPNGLMLTFDGFMVPARATSGIKSGGTAALCLRTERLHYSPTPGNSQAISIPAVVKARQYAGGSIRSVIALPSGRELIAEGHSEAAGHIGAGDQVFITWNPREAAVVQ